MPPCPLPIPMKAEPVPVRTGQLERKETKREPIPLSTSRKRSIEELNSSASASAKRVKTEPEPPTRTITTKTNAPAPHRSQRVLKAKTSQPVPQNVSISKPLSVLEPARRSKRLCASAPNAEPTPLITPVQSSLPEGPMTKVRSRKSSKRPRRSGAIQKASLSRKKKVTRDRASIVLNGDLEMPTVTNTPPPPFIPSPLHVADHEPVSLPVTSIPTSKHSPHPSLECEIVQVTPPSPPSPPSPSQCVKSTESPANQPVSTAAVVNKVDGVIELCLTYGLVVVERSPKTKEAEWVACKFCPTFGCKNRNRTYIMAYMKPFNKGKIIGHLTSGHPKSWPKYHNANSAGKTKIFEGKQLPGRQVFQERVMQLKSSWGILSKEGQSNRNEKRKEAREELEDLYYGREEEEKKFVDKSEIVLRSGTALRPVEMKANDLEKAWTENDSLIQKRFAREIRIEAEALLRDDAVILSESRVLRSGKIMDVEKNAVNLAKAYGMCQTDWMGRNEFRNGTAQLGRKRLFLYGDARLKNQVVKKLKEPLWASRNKLPFLWLPKEIRDVLLNGVLSDASRCISKSGLFFHPEEYLLEHEGMGKQKWDPTPRSFGWKELLFMTVLTYLCRGLSIYTAEELLEPMVKRVAPKWVEEEESVGDMVWRIGNSICAESLRLLREVLKSEYNWLLLPTFAPCEAMGESGVELFVPILYKSELYFFHLISIRDGENVGDSVMSVLQAVCEDWEWKIGGFYSHISCQDKLRKTLEEKIMRKLGERAKLYPLRKFEKGQKEVQEVTVGRLCEMGSDSVVRMVSMFLQPFLASKGSESAVAVLEIIRKEHNGLITGESIEEKHKKRKLGALTWKMLRKRFIQNLAKYTNGLQVIWRQDFRGGFLDRHAAVAKCGIVKDWRCDRAVDATLERTAHARNVGRIRCLTRFPMKFECTQDKHRLYNFESAHVFDSNWSNMKGRPFNN